MLTDSQTLNTQTQKYSKLSPERTAGGVGNQKGPEKLQTADSSFSDLSQDIIKELTLKNKLLNAQLVEYRTLVANLNARLQSSGEENQKLSQLLNQREDQERKLHTIQEQLNSMSEITTKSRRRDCEEERGQHYFHQMSQLLNSFELLPDSMNWESYIDAVECVLQERRQMMSFIGRIKEMRQSIEPGEVDLFSLWDWLRRVGLNYSYLMQYNRRPRDKKYNQK